MKAWGSPWGNFMFRTVFFLSGTLWICALQAGEAVLRSDTQLLSAPKVSAEGVLLLNATLTVRAHQAGSHQKKGWEMFTDSVIGHLGASRKDVVYFLWGSYAQKKAAMVSPTDNLVLKSPHPSPLSAYRGFFGENQFSKANEYLASNTYGVCLVKFLTTTAASLSVWSP